MTQRRRVDTTRISIAAIAIGLAVFVVFAVRAGDTFTLLWIGTFAAVTIVIGAGWLGVLAYLRRAGYRARGLEARYPGAVIVSTFASPRFVARSREIASLIGTNVGSLAFPRSLSIVVGTDGMTVFAGYPEAEAVLSVPREFIEVVGRNSDFDVDGTPVPGIRFTIGRDDRRIDLNAWVTPSAVRPAVMRMRDLLA